MKKKKFIKVLRFIVSILGRALTMKKMMIVLALVVGLMAPAMADDLAPGHTSKPGRWSSLTRFKGGEPRAGIKASVALR